MLTVNGEGPADLDPGRLNDVGDVDTPEKGLDVKRKVDSNSIFMKLYPF